jgi:hypothetical protein
VGFDFDRPARAAFADDCERRVEEAIGVWARFAQARGLAMSHDPSTGLPRFTGRLQSVDLAVTALGNPRDGYRTRASAEVALPLDGRVRIGVPSAIAAIVGQLRPRRFFGERGAPELDAALVVSSRPSDLAGRIVDAGAAAIMQRLAGQRLDDFTYEGGAVAVVWAGIERDASVLDGVLELLVRVATLARDQTAYR